MNHSRFYAFLVRSFFFYVLIFLFAVVSSCKNHNEIDGWRVTASPAELKWGFFERVNFHAVVGSSDRTKTGATVRLKFPPGVFGRPYDLEAARLELRRETKIKSPQNCPVAVDLEGAIDKAGPFDILLTFPSSCRIGDESDVAFLFPSFYVEGAVKIGVEIEAKKVVKKAPDIVFKVKRLKPGADDGLGSYEFKTDHAITAGEPVAWTVLYKVGDKALQSGAVISVMAPHALYSTHPRTVVPGLIGVALSGVSVEGPNGIIFESKTTKRPSNNSFDVSVKSGNLNPGDIVEITFSKSVFYISGEWVPQVWLDGDGDGSFAKVKGGSMLRVNPGKAAVNRIIISSPNIARKQAIKRHLLTDEFGNPADVDATIIPDDNYFPHLDSAMKSGEYWQLKFITAEKTGDDENSYIARLPGNTFQPQIFWGDLHGHTALSDGTGTPKEYFFFAKNTATLDFAAITDHENQLTDDEWNEIIGAANSVTVDGEFVGIAAAESNGAGMSHVNMYFEENAALPPPRFGEGTDHYFAEYNGNNLSPRFISYDDIKSLSDRAKMFAAIHKASSMGAISQFLPVVTQPVMEIYSNQGCAEEPGKPWSVLMDAKTDETVSDLPKRDLKIGFIGGSDNHDGRPGMSMWDRFSNGLTGVKAERLTRKDIFDAIRKRRTWVTTGERGYFDFRINDQPEGSEIRAKAGNVSVRIIAAVPVAKSLEIRHYYEGKWSVIQIQPVNGLPVPLWDYSSAINLNEGKHTLYVRVMGADFPIAWSSPIWLLIKTPKR